MASSSSFVINPGGGGAGGPSGCSSSTSYVIPKRRNAPEEKEREKLGAAADGAKFAVSGGRANDKKDTTMASGGGSTAVSGIAAVTLRNRLNVWTGSLRFEDQTVESVDLYSPFRDGAKPSGFSASLEIKLLLTSADCQAYAPIAELLNIKTHGAMLRRPYTYICLTPSSSSSSTTSGGRPPTTPMQASYLYLTNTFSPLFARIYDRLKAKEIIALSILADDDAVVFLLPEGVLTERLGLPAHHDKPVFHCIFLRPRPDIAAAAANDGCRRGQLPLITMDHIPTEPTALDKLDGAEDAVLAMFDQYRQTCGLPTAKRAVASPINSLLSPGKPPPGGKPPTPYIPTPGSATAGSSGYAPVALLKQRATANTFGYHSSSQQQQQNGGQDWQALLQPPPPPPAMSSSTIGGGTPRGILTHHGGAFSAHNRRPADVLRSPGTEARRNKNQTLVKNALEQLRKINAESKSAPLTDLPLQPFIPPLKTPSPQRAPPAHSHPPFVATSTNAMDSHHSLLAPPPSAPVLPNVPRDPRLLKHNATTTSSALAAAPPLHKSQHYKYNSNIPLDTRPNASPSSQPSDPRLNRGGAVTMTTTIAPTLSLLAPPPPPPPVSVPSPPPPPPPPVSIVPAPNLGFKRAYGSALKQLSSSSSSTAAAAAADDGAPLAEKKLKMLPPPPPPPPQDDNVVLQHESLQQQQLHPDEYEDDDSDIHNESGDTIAEPVPNGDADDIHNDSTETNAESVPMDIDNDEDSRPYSPSQAIPPTVVEPTQLEHIVGRGGQRTEYQAEEGELVENEKVEEKGKTVKVEIVEADDDAAAAHKSPPEPMTGAIHAKKANAISTQSPISLVRSLIPSPTLPKASPPKPSSARRAKMPASASLNASGFGFDFLNWNSSAADSTANETQMSSASSSSTASSTALRVDETFDVEELLKQAESSTVSKSVVEEGEDEEEEEDSDLRFEQHEKDDNDEASQSEAVENKNVWASPSSAGNTTAAAAQSTLLSVPPPTPLMALALPAIVTKPPPASPPTTNGISGTHSAAANNKLVAHLRQAPPHVGANRFTASTTASPLLHATAPSPRVVVATSSRPIVHHPSPLSACLMHRLDVPPPVLHLPPPPVQQVPPPPIIVRRSSTTTAVAASLHLSSTTADRATVSDLHHQQTLTGMNTTTFAANTSSNSICTTAIVLLDPEMIMCGRIQLAQLRAVFSAARRNAVIIFWHQMITDKLIEVGVKAKPYLTLVDEFVAAATVERMEAHQCDKRGLDLHKLLACTCEVAAHERQRNREPKVLRAIFLSAMINADSDEAADFVNEQIEVLNAGQFVEQFK